MERSCALNFNAELISDKAVSALIGVSFFILAMAFGAYIRIPVPGTPVPITLQTFFVVLSGAVLGKRLGVLSQAGYLLLGAMGLPVFQGCAFGISHILGPTGGYLAGFIFAAYFVGRMLESDKGIPNIRRIITVFIAGNFILYAFGIAWLMFLYRIDLAASLSLGLLPFIPGEILKISLATIVYSKIRPRSKAIFHN